MLKFILIGSKVYKFYECVVFRDQRVFTSNYKHKHGPNNLFQFYYQNIIGTMYLDIIGKSNEVT